jgi:hypothetical protein
VETTMEQIRQDAADCDARKVAQARRMSGPEKLRAGAELFEDACEMTMHGIRAQNPQWNEQQCSEELKRRLALT